MMKYTSLEAIDAEFPEPQNEIQIARNRRLKLKRQAISRFNEREQKRLAAEASQPSQAGSSQIQTRSQTAANIVASQIQTRSRTAARGVTPQAPIRSGTTASNTLRKQKSRVALTNVQKQHIRERDKIRHAERQEQLRAQFLQIVLAQSRTTTNKRRTSRVSRLLRKASYNIDRKHFVHSGDAWYRRNDGGALGRGWPLRCHRLFGFAAHSGNRYSHGARRSAKGCDQALPR